MKHLLLSALPLAGKRTVFSVLAVLIPQLVLAQALASTPDRRPFFVDFRCGYNNCLIRYRLNSRVMHLETEMVKDGPFSTIPVTVGYYFTPRLAVQVGGAYGCPTEDLPTGTRQVPNGVYSGNTHYTYQTGGVWVVSRYAVLPKKQRLQVDALLGVVWAYDSYEAHYYSTFNGVVLQEQTQSDHGAQFLGTVGLGFRYSFGRHVELLYDHAWNRNLDAGPLALQQSVIGNAYGLTPNRSLSLRYRFNWHKPLATPPAP